MSSRRLLDAKEIDRTLARIAHEIVEKNKGTGGLCLVGIRTGGVPLASRLKEKIKEIEGTAPEMGILDITLYRDDWSTLSQHPIVRSTEIPFSIDNKTIVLVDDVIYTGRTIRAALDALTDYGRPGRIELAVLVDRGRRELPVQPDFTGISLATSKDEHVNVYLEEITGRDEVLIEKADNES
ncbi:MAG: bifunctional pyr operon transcriptional regulator/uracil phosphoribosyltransferase PyrR [Thermodesulfatator sp.]|nr:MAG: bifunctional pyr operon transcriptional regulator/uracil phosphoribosyltransferase PyrR [Thermodesulfatator sp.]